MPRRPAKNTQADIARALRAAKEAGAGAVTIDTKGVIRITLEPSTMAGSAAPIESASDDESEMWTPSDALKRRLKSAESS
jgi:hypothetical protein